ncbi:hypothetical protein PALB_18940 [Pseudoalteromonas luteoviolacea B = ATCC 29581]|nr:hypothetical protein PALB_18940 [Pseudoalteromonas luteoviolacea B = ATCC 29581]
MNYLVIGVIASAFLAGCQAPVLNKHITAESKTQKKVQLALVSKLNHTLFVPQSIPSDVKLFELPDEEQTQFLRYFEKYAKLGEREDKIISNYLETFLAGFRFDGATLTAKESLAGHKGNCISLAILTEAYANLVGIKTSFTEVSSIPVFQIQHSTVLVANHFKTKLHAPVKEHPKEQDWIRFHTAGTVVDYFPSLDSVFIGNASKTDLLAKFYSNRSVDAMLEADYDLSYSYLKEATRYAPNDPELLNLAALLHKRRGDLSTAKQLFQFGFEQNLSSYNLLSNYLTVLDKTKDADLITAIRARFEVIEKNPIDRLMLAKDYLRDNQLTLAEAQLAKVIDQLPYLPEPYIELAKIAYLRGYTGQARRLLDLAKKKTSQKEKLAIIEAKKSALSRLKIETKP